ncbi:MAG: flagellar assembly protein FliW [Candidatus Kapaibacterium sp.]
MAKDENSKSRKINTLQFGEISVDPEHIFVFPGGMLGFENLREFVLISEEETVPFKWLISLEEPEIGFPLLSPWHIDISYDPGKGFDYDKQVIFVVVTLEDDEGLMTSNMKAPLVLDVEKQVGQQVILPTDKYSPNYVIRRREEEKQEK